MLQNKRINITTVAVGTQMFQPNSMKYLYLTQTNGFSCQRRCLFLSFWDLQTFFWFVIEKNIGGGMVLVALNWIHVTTKSFEIERAVFVYFYIFFPFLEIQFTSHASWLSCSFLFATIIKIQVISSHHFMVKQILHTSTQFLSVSHTLYFIVLLNFTLY